MVSQSEVGDADNDLNSSIVLSELKSRNSHAFDKIMHEHEEQCRKEAEDRRRIRQRERSKQCSELQLRHKQTIPSNAAKAEARPKAESLKSKGTTAASV